MPDSKSLKAPGGGVWATDATDRVVFVHSVPSSAAADARDVRVGMHALDSTSPTLQSLKPWYRQARSSLKPLRYESTAGQTDKRRQRIGGWLTPLLERGRFAGMLCTVSSKPNRGTAPAETRDACDPAAPGERFAFWEVEASTGRLQCSASLEGLLGYAEGEIGPRAADYLRIVHPDDRLRVTSACSAALGQPAGSLELQCRVVRKDGGVRWVLVAGVPRHSPAGAPPVAACGVIRDITAAREAGQALRDSEALHRSVVELQTEVISRFLPDGTLVFVNEPYCRLFGRQRAELVGQRWQPVAYPDDVPMIEARLRSMSAADPVVVIDNRVFVADGSLRWMQFVNRGLYDGDGRLTEVQSVGRDLTQVRRIEAELRDSEERLKMALAGAAQVSWDWNIPARSVEATATWVELLGHTHDPALQGEDEWLALIHPEDLEGFRRRLDAHLAGESALFESEHRLRHQAGHWLWVEARGKVTRRAEDGQALRMVGTLRDVTQRRRLHEEGVELLQRIEALIRDATQAPAPTATAEAALDGLTRREREVLMLIAQGMSSAQIGRHLHLSTNTVASHRRNLMAKLDLHSSVEIARFVHQHGFPSAP